MTADWHRIVAVALTGQDPGRARDDDTSSERPDTGLAGPEFDPDGLRRLLTELGWTRTRLDAVRAAAAESGRPYPFPVPPELRPGIGAAQLAAVVRQARLSLGLLGTPGVVSTRTRPDADERRLLADVPPHYL